jgi:hypothetical protein
MARDLVSQRCGLQGSHSLCDSEDNAESAENGEPELEEITFYHVLQIRQSWPQGAIKSSLQKFNNNGRNSVYLCFAQTQNIQPKPRGGQMRP